MLAKLRERIDAILNSGTGASRRPQLDKHNQSNVHGLFVIGDLAGAPVIKLAMAQGFEAIEHLASLPPVVKDARDDLLDVVIIGAGASGLNAALEAQGRGMKYVLLEKEKIANTIENFPEGKFVYAEPDSKPPKGKLWLDGATKEDLIRRWHQIIEDNHLNVHAGEGVTAVEKQKDGTFVVRTSAGSYAAQRVILATGQRGNPRKLGVPGEDRERVYHRLYSPRKYKGERIVVVGGGNSAVEAALTLAERNEVVLSYRGEGFDRIFKDNERLLNEAVAAGRVRVKFKTNVAEFGEEAVKLREGGEAIPYDHAFVLVGAEVPVKFLKSLGIKLENEWEGNFGRAAALALVTLVGLWFLGGHAAAFGFQLTAVPAAVGGLIALAAGASLLTLGMRGDRYAWLGLSFLVWYSIYGIKVGKGSEFWPYRDWGYGSLSFAGRPWSFWYTVLYTTLMTLFGIQALKRWGLDRKDKFQIWRYVSLLSFQWIFFFLVPEFLFQWAIQYQWVGAQLAGDPTFADQAWRSYGLVYAWPLFFYTFFYDPHQIWVVWGVLLTFVVIPVFVLFNGKRYCSWVCGCGGLAETFGDRWRHLAPKGKASIRWEWMGNAVLIAAAGITLLMLGKDAIGWFRTPADKGIWLYRIVADVWLVGILPVTLYPFLGGKVWCRYWCPLAKMMQIQSKVFAKIGWSRFKITANDKCIGCHECSRNCQVGIDVMQYALKQQVLDNETSSCIGCGICVT
ncbi:MAG: NAD(P)-binding domain-containing protein, partial [Myxococcales bacterium]|nr:NAD(P)-binding domain-containing protein [Myxococcales bacterium]